MDKTYRTEFRRKYLIEALPEPLTRASRHLQLFDNYIAGTRIRIRTVRDPETKAWSWLLQQRLALDVSGLTYMKIGEIRLNEAEHAAFETFEGNEIRKNRYFHEFDSREFAFDMFLWPLWGLNIASVELSDEASFIDFEPPPFAVLDITGNTFFLGENLLEKKFDDVQDEVSRIGVPVPVKTGQYDE